MSYSHRMTLAVPQALMAQANQLALIVGESVDDDKTFTNANWQDKDGNLYAVCSTVIKPVVLNIFGINLADMPLPGHAQHADVDMAQAALDIVIMYEQGMTVSTDKIVCGIDIDPMKLFEAIGLTMVESDIDI